jgi:Beta-lactamase enzyme family
MRFKNNLVLLLSLSIYFICGCHNSKKAVIMPTPTITEGAVNLVVDNAKTDAYLEKILQQYPQYFSEVLKNKKAWNTQIVYTQIDRNNNGIPTLTNHYFNVNAADYFYPASTVKFPISLLALQKLNELKNTGIDKNTTMITEAAYSGQTPVYNDPTTADGKPSIAHYIKKILMVSDNEAYNRLYEFLGQQYINDQLHQKGYTDVQILHRLQIPLSADENRHTNPINFLDANNNVFYQQPMLHNTTLYKTRKDSVGKGYYKGEVLINEPMNFSLKNKIGLEDLHQILIGVVFPEKIPAKQRINITAEDRNFVLKYMSQLPTESTYPPYAVDTANYYPAYCKFLLHGSQKGELPKNIRIFNKVGDAYGQLIDVAYVVDFENKVEFFLSASMYCNGDNILNDDKYDYDNIGYPFMKNLGKVIYDNELKRTKKILPDLSSLIFEYDKK